MYRDIGVVVGRFQSPDLHSGHHFVIREAINHHERVLVVIGCSPLPLTLRNPMDFETRAMMITRAYPDVVVARIEDSRSDEIWSARLDEIIHNYFPDRSAVLYGSRQSFIPHYTGKHQCEMLTPPEPIEGLNATDLRNRVQALGSRDFRAGMIYGSRLPFPTSYQVVDIAVINEANQMVLLGHKIGDGDKHRFIGGFVDPTDETLERAAKREVVEETSGIETADYEYLGSVRIDDWRYKGNRDQVMSAFFKAKYIFGRPCADDDLDGLGWFPLSKLEDLIIPEHLPLVKMLLANMFHPPVGYAGML